MSNASQIDLDASAVYALMSMLGIGLFGPDFPDAVRQLAAAMPAEAAASAQQLLAFADQAAALLPGEAPSDA